MSFVVYTDGCSNLPGRILKELDIRVLPCSYVMDDVPGTYEGDIDAFDTKGYYNKLRAGSVMKTSLLNSQLFMDHFRPPSGTGTGCCLCGHVLRHQRHLPGREDRRGGADAGVP